MTLYLQMNGVSDRIQLPSMTFTDVVLEMSVTRSTSSAKFYLDARPGIGFGYFQSNTNGTDSWSTFNEVDVDGVSKSNNTAMVPNDQKTIVKVVKWTAGTDDVTIFSNNGGSANTYLNGKIYSIKVNNGATLQASYDMSTGTVQDISGNGNHATLTGGTWVDDGTGGGTPTFTDGSALFNTKQTIYSDSVSTFDTKQSIYQDNLLAFDTKQTVYNDSFISSDTKQVIYNDSLSTFDTKQSIYQDNLINLDTKQVIYSDSSVSFDTLQQIQSGGVDGSVTFDTKQTLYSDSSVQFDTKQGLYSDSQVIFNTKQAYYNDGFASFDTLQVIEKIDWVDGSVSFDTQQLITETPKVVAQEVNLTFIAENEVNLSSEIENSVSLSFTI
jgi:hypothetical protein